MDQSTEGAGIVILKLPHSPLISFRRKTDISNSTQPRTRTQFMKSPLTVNTNGSLLRKTAWLGLLAIAAGLTAIQRTEAAGNITVWDTASHLADPTDAENRNCLEVRACRAFLRWKPSRRRPLPIRDTMAGSTRSKATRSWRTAASLRCSGQRRDEWRSTQGGCAGEDRPRQKNSGVRPAANKDPAGEDHSV